MFTSYPTGILCIKFEDGFLHYYDALGNSLVDAFVGPVSSVQTLASLTDCII